MLDTADVYGGGASEQLLGRWRSSRPDDVTNKVVFATKARFGTGPDVNDVGSSRRHLSRALDTSLKRLGVETIDLYQIHGWDPLTPVEETLTFLDAAVRAGKIHYIGLSNFTGWQLQLVLSTAKAMGLQLPVTLQQQYSLASREIEYEVIPAALHNDVGLLSWSPLASGFLSGKYTRKEDAGSDTRLGSGNSMFRHIGKDLFASDRNWATLGIVRDIAGETGATVSQVALSWVTNRPGVTATIIGARTMNQLKDNLLAADLRLGAEATKRLNEISSNTPNDYPYGLFGMLQRRRYIDSSDQALRELPPA
jgi:aryl-alcohol dehydrogenase-like predicted oxidoreductase